MNTDLAVKLVDAVDLLRQYGWNGPHLCVTPIETHGDPYEVAFVRPGRGNPDEPKPADHREPQLEKVIGSGWQEGWYEIRLYDHRDHWKFEICVMVPANPAEYDNHWEIYDGWDEMVLNEGNLQAAHEHFGLEYPRPNPTE